MNAYFENTGYRTNTRRESAIPTRRFGDGFIELVCAIIGMLTCTAAIKIEKTTLSLALFLSCFGIIGAIDSGAISMLLGIILCAAISLCQYATLKSLFKRATK